MISLISSLSLKLYLIFIDVSSKHLRVFLENLRKSSVMFGNFRKMFGNVRRAFGTILENLWKSSESGWKSLKNHQTRRQQYVYLRKRTSRVSSKIFMNFMFSWHEQYPTRSLRSLVRYFSCHCNKIHILSSPCNILYIFHF